MVEILAVEKPDQPPRQPFGDAVQLMRRELRTTLVAHEIFARNAVEILERPNCTLRHLKFILDGVVGHLSNFIEPQHELELWSQQPLSDVGLDLPLGKMPQSGEPNHG